MRLIYAHHVTQTEDLSELADQATELKQGYASQITQLREEDVVTFGDKTPRKLPTLFEESQQHINLINGQILKLTSALTEQNPQIKVKDSAEIINEACIWLEAIISEIKELVREDTDQPLEEQ